MACEGYAIKTQMSCAPRKTGCVFMFGDEHHVLTPAMFV